MRAAIVAALLGSCGCATLVYGTHADVAIESNPSGADFQVHDHEGALVASGETPAKVSLARGRGVFRPGIYELTLSKTGYLSKRTPLKTRLNALGWVDWLLVFPASLVDIFTGGCWKIEDPPVQVLAPDVPFLKPQASAS